MTRKSRQPLTIGWEAARANAVPALVIQTMMLALLIAYYTNDASLSALNQLADYKRTHGLGFVILASVAAGAIIPEIFLIRFFSTWTPKPAKPSQSCVYDPGLGIRRIACRSSLSQRGELARRRCHAAGRRRPRFASINLATIHCSPRHSAC